MSDDRLTIVGGSVVTPDGVEVADVTIEGGRVARASLRR